MKTSKLTVRFEIVDSEAAEGLWEAAGKKTAILGMLPRAISWGDLFAELEATQGRYEIAKFLLERARCWEELDILDRLEKLWPMDKIREPYGKTKSSRDGKADAASASKG